MSKNGNGQIKSNGILNRYVLVLNQAYEPVMVTNAKRAVVLLLLEKAEELVNYNEMIHSTSWEMPLPSIVRLARYIPIQRREVVLTRKNLLKRDNHACQYCGRSSVPLTIDHIIPRQNGGKNSWENLVAACHPCNVRKGNKTPTEALMPLLRTPFKPSRITYFQKFVRKHQDPWRPYLYMEPAL
ncbi:MAG: HNH endonuclease [Candidatus Marinimicrobia bacterium]|nr:HNH endonuclease [Candidatus Neomarinimicrobiota bacterium]